MEGNNKKLRYKKGQAITCTWDHKIFTIKEDVFEGESFNPKKHCDFERNQNVPREDTPLDCCLCWCGHDYIRPSWPDGNKIVLHTSYGWA